MKPKTGIPKIEYFDELLSNYSQCKPVLSFKEFTTKHHAHWLKECQLARAAGLKVKAARKRRMP